MKNNKIFFSLLVSFHSDIRQLKSAGTLATLAMEAKELSRPRFTTATAPATLVVLTLTMR